MTNTSTHQESSVNLQAIGHIKTPYNEKFAIPRQPGLVDAAKGVIRLSGEANNIELVRGLEQFSHIWVIFVFHATETQGWKPLVRPPRLGGNKKLGVLATRSTFRPNPLGMSVVKLDKVTTDAQGVAIHVSGIDLLNNTPILDIKPYIPYSDSISAADAGFAQETPEQTLKVTFSETATAFLSNVEQTIPEFKTLIIQVLEQDPRPAYKQKAKDDKIYGISLFQYNIKWRLITASTIEVFKIELIDLAE